MKKWIGLWLLLGGSAQADVLSCLLEPSQQTDVSAQTTGVVQRVFVERGDKVSKGQPLLELHHGLESAALSSAKQKANFALRKLERNSELLEKKLLSEYESDELYTEHSLALLAVKEAEEKLTQKKLQSPIDGVVTRRMIAVGEFVGVDPVLTLVSLNPLYAELVLTAADYKQLATLRAARLQVGEKQVSAKVLLVDPVIDAASGTFGMRLQVDNPNGDIPAGLPCVVTGFDPVE